MKIKAAGGRLYFLFFLEEGGQRIPSFLFYFEELILSFCPLEKRRYSLRLPKLITIKLFN